MLWLLFLVIALSIGGVLGYYDAKLEASVTKGNLSKVDVGDDVKFDNDVVNILLVGSDRRSDETEAGRSDSSMIATINMKTKELKLTSLMRDMYVDIPGHGRNKLNSASFGGVDLLYETIAQNFDIKIDKYCVVDFSTFEKVINEVGGIEIDLEEKDRLSEYDQLHFQEEIPQCKSRKSEREPGSRLFQNPLCVKQQVRRREFGRPGRQRKPLIRFIRQNPMKILDIRFNALDDVSTDMNASYIKGLVTSVVQFGVPKVRHAGFRSRALTCRAGHRAACLSSSLILMQIRRRWSILSSAKEKKRISASKFGGYQNIETLRLSCKTGFRGCFGGFPRKL